MRLRERPSPSPPSGTGPPRHGGRDRLRPSPCRCSAPPARTPPTPPPGTGSPSARAAASWSADLGNGYYGGLQFTQEMWDEYGGLDYAARPDLASRSQQIAVAETILDDQGPHAWPSCAVIAGLTRTAPRPRSTRAARADSRGRRADSSDSLGPRSSDSSDSSGRPDSGSRTPTAARRHGDEPSDPTPSPDARRPTDDARTSPTVRPTPSDRRRPADRAAAPRRATTRTTRRRRRGNRRPAAPAARRGEHQRRRPARPTRRRRPARPAGRRARAATGRRRRDYTVRAGDTLSAIADALARPAAGPRSTTATRRSSAPTPT